MHGHSLSIILISHASVEVIDVEIVMYSLVTIDERSKDFFVSLIVLYSLQI
jgi:hypothetical protein